MLRHNEWLKREFAKNLTISTKHQVKNSYGDVVAEFEYLQHALEYLERKEDVQRE